MNHQHLARVASLILWTALALSTCYHLFFWREAGWPAMARPVRFYGATVVVDAGHGGEDGGAVSPAGTVESGVNLAIARRLDLLLGFYGADVVMLRTEDVSLHDPDAATLRQKKSSDLHNRAERIASIPNATLISIHQNTFSGGSRYHGAQVFFSPGEESRMLAVHTQEVLRLALDPDNSREAAQIPESVYLMNHIDCRAILVECGFLSNPAEDALLQTGGYQTKIATALAAAYLSGPEPDF